ncbi:MAG: antibiotic biosynthesis monooxygenase, partial [Cyanobacteria bacterium J06638_6]
MSTPATNPAPADQGQHVTAVITHRVKAGREDGYEAWIKGIAAAARNFPGHLGVSILRPQPGASSDYVIVLRFDTCKHLTDWLNSAIRKD